MTLDRSLTAGSTTTLVLKLLEARDMYGYEMIEALAERSEGAFALKAGTLYPLLHGLEREGLVSAYERRADGDRVRRYYHLTADGARLLAEKEREWREFSGAVDRVLNGGAGA